MIDRYYFFPGARKGGGGGGGAAPPGSPGPSCGDVLGAGFGAQIRKRGGSGGKRLLRAGALPCTAGAVMRVLCTWRHVCTYVRLSAFGKGNGWLVQLETGRRALPVLEGEDEMRGDGVRSVIGMRVWLAPSSKRPRVSPGHGNRPRSTGRLMPPERLPGPQAPKLVRGSQTAPLKGWERCKQYVNEMLISHSGKHATGI